jgi:hypothetical protein
MENDPDFKKYVGDLLVDIMFANIDEEFIDENRTDDFETLGLQRGVYEKGSPFSED